MELATSPDTHGAVLKSKFWYLATVALIACGTAFAQNRVPQTPIMDSYTAGLLSCVCATDNHDGHGTPGFVRKSEEMRAKAWEPANNVLDTARTMLDTTQGAMGANEGRSLKDTGLRPSDGRASAK